MTEKEEATIAEAKTVIGELAVAVGKVIAERDVSQAEIAALRAKLAAAEADIAGKRAVIEASRAAINGQIKDCLKVEDDYANFRATVAAALTELRAEWNAQYQDYVSKTDDGSWERRQELLTRMRELDATIAKLDLEEQPK